MRHLGQPLENSYDLMMRKNAMEWVTVNISSVAPYFTVGKDIAMAGIAVYAAVIARRGLSTWNRQLKGSTQYDLARRILKGTYRLRESLAEVRHPAIFRSEQPIPPEEFAEHMTDKQKHHYGIAKAYENRWQELTVIRNDLEAELLEAEALWGHDFLTTFQPLFDLQATLYATVNSYLVACDPDETEETRRVFQESYLAKKGVLYRTFSPDSPDPFRDQIYAAIAAVESVLKPHLLRG